MAAQVGPGDPMWRFDEREFEVRAAAVFKNNNITTDQQRAAFVAGLTAPQLTLVVQALLNCFVSGPPNA
jgi:hypothetical protein